MHDGGQNIRNNSKCNDVYYNIISNYDLNAKTYNLTTVVWQCKKHELPEIKGIIKVDFIAEQMLDYIRLHRRTW